MQTKYHERILKYIEDKNSSFIIDAEENSETRHKKRKIKKRHKHEK